MLSFTRKRNTKGECNQWILSYLTDESIFIGWIRDSDFSINKLRKLGVRGPMRWTGGVVEKCVVTKEVGQKLKSLGVDMSTFTETDKYGKQISHAGHGI